MGTAREIVSSLRVAVMEGSDQRGQARWGRAVQEIGRAGVRGVMERDAEREG